MRIPCHGEQLAAYVYRPGSTQGDAPCVVMAHGFSGTRDDGLPGYAEAFRDAGFVVVLFDYRHFGASTGEPRQLLDIARQLDDYRAVIEWARGLDGIDPDRIVLWGTSYSGGHVLTLAAADDAHRGGDRTRAVHRQHRHNDVRARPEISPALWWRPCVISSEHGWAAHRAWYRPSALRARSPLSRHRGTSRLSRLSSVRTRSGAMSLPLD